MLETCYPLLYHIFPVLEWIVTLLPLCASIRLRRACIVIIQCTLAWIYFHVWFWAPKPKKRPPIASQLFPVPPGRELGYGCAN